MVGGYKENPQGDGLYKYSPDNGENIPGAMSYNDQLSSYDKSNAPRVNDGKSKKSMRY